VIQQEKRGILLIDVKKRHGVFSFNELITTDLDSAKKFYGELLGWSFKETKTIHGNRYLVALKDGSIVAGMMLKEGNVDDEVLPCWDPYITVDDVEISAKIVEKMGGKILLPPTDIPGTGRFVVIMDPQGVAMNLISSVDEGKEEHVD
jgi:predicted enzyme related to lactoylglutathione lyase